MKRGDFVLFLNSLFYISVKNLNIYSNPNLDWNLTSKLWEIVKSKNWPTAGKTGPFSSTKTPNKVTPWKRADFVRSCLILPSVSYCLQSWITTKSTFRRCILRVLTYIHVFPCIFKVKTWRIYNGDNKEIMGKTFVNYITKVLNHIRNNH